MVFAAASGSSLASWITPACALVGGLVVAVSTLRARSYDDLLEDVEARVDRRLETRIGALRDDLEEHIDDLETALKREFDHLHAPWKDS